MTVCAGICLLAAANANGPMVLADNFGAHPKSKPGTGRFFRRKKWFKNAVKHFVGHTAPGIKDRNTHTVRWRVAPRTGTPEPEYGPARAPGSWLRALCNPGGQEAAQFPGKAE